MRFKILVLVVVLFFSISFIKDSFSQTFRGSCNVITTQDHRSYIMFNQDSTDFTKWNFERLYINLENKGFRYSIIISEERLVYDILDCYYSNIFCNFLEDRYPIYNKEFKIEFNYLIKRAVKERYIRRFRL